MNPTDDKLPAIDDRQFDLLVDAELTEAERRELLTSLDEVPDGWRRCALAFLEAQSWREELSPIRRQEASKPRPRRSLRRWVPSGPWATALAMAASFLVALVLGLMVRDVDQPASRIAEGLGESAAVPHGLASVELPQLGPADAPWQIVTLPVSSGPEGAPRLIQLPATESSDIDTSLEAFPAAVPDELLQALERSGHRIQRQRRLFPFSMEDGRQLVVPVDQIEVRYVDNPAYQ